MKRSELFCVVALLGAVPGAALAGLYPGALRGIGGNDDMAAAFTAVAAKSAVTAQQPVVPKPTVSKPVVSVVPSGTQVTATGMVRQAPGPSTGIGGAPHALTGQISGTSFKVRHP